jgi:hypothetical protein
MGILLRSSSSTAVGSSALGPCMERQCRCVPPALQARRGQRGQKRAALHVAGRIRAGVSDAHTRGSTPPGGLLGGRAPQVPGGQQAGAVGADTEPGEVAARRQQRERESVHAARPEGGRRGGRQHHRARAPALADQLEEHLRPAQGWVYGPRCCGRGRAFFMSPPPRCITAPQVYMLSRARPRSCCAAPADGAARTGSASGAARVSTPACSAEH